MEEAAWGLLDSPAAANRACSCPCSHRRIRSNSSVHFAASRLRTNASKSRSTVSMRCRNWPTRSSHESLLALLDAGQLGAADGQRLRLEGEIVLLIDHLDLRLVDVLSVEVDPINRLVRGR